MKQFSIMCYYCQLQWTLFGFEVQWTLFGSEVQWTLFSFNQKASTCHHTWRQNRLHPFYYSGRSGRPWTLWTLFGDALLCIPRCIFFKKCKKLINDRQAFSPFSLLCIYYAWLNFQQLSMLCGVKTRILWKRLKGAFFSW